MQQISSLFDKIERPVAAARSAKEDLINQIVERTTADKKLLARRIAIWVNRYKLTETDLHALLAKASDPAIRNFTAFVQWTIKDSAKKEPKTDAI